MRVPRSVLHSGLAMKQQPDGAVQILLLRGLCLSAAP